MSGRIGLGRHGRLSDETAGDPLDGLVNLFDIGIVLAIAFLVAGLGLTRDPVSGSVQPRPSATPIPGAQAGGRGEAVGEVYRLQDGTLVLVGPDGSRTPIEP